jgi:predicted transcriptional regulator
MVGMARSPKPPKPPKKSRGPVLFIRLDDRTEAELVAFMRAQRVEPDRSAVGLKALHEFLEREGFRKADPR